MQSNTNGALTHGGSTLKQWGELISATLLNLLQGESLYHSITAGAIQSELDIDGQILRALSDHPDSIVVGSIFRQPVMSSNPSR